VQRLLLPQRRFDLGFALGMLKSKLVQVQPESQVLQGVALALG